MFSCRLEALDNIYTFYCRKLLFLVLPGVAMPNVLRRSNRYAYHDLI